VRLLEVTEVQLDWADLDNLTYHERPSLIRSPGCHASDVLKFIAEERNLYDNEDRRDGMPLRILLGLGFEEAAARLYPDMWWQPGEMEHDGVIGSPDGISHIGGLYQGEDSDGVWQFNLVDAPCVDEFKYSGKSMRIKGAKTQADGTVAPKDIKDIRTEWMWVQQVQTYINLIRRQIPGHEKLNLGRLHICWKYGAYTRPFEEKYMRYLVQFDEKELRGNWAMVQMYKKQVIEANQ